MKSIADQIDPSGIAKAGRARAEIAGRLDSLRAELARADAALADYRAARDELTAASAEVEAASAAAFRKPSPAAKVRQDKAEKTAKVAQDKADGLRPSAKGAKAAREGILAEIAEAEASLAECDMAISSAIAEWCGEGEELKLAEAAALIDRLGHVLADLDALGDLMELHGSPRHSAVRELLERWKNADPNRRHLAGLVTYRKSTGIVPPDWFKVPVVNGTATALASAVENAAAVPGGPKRHHYRDTEAYKKALDRAAFWGTRA